VSTTDLLHYLPIADLSELIRRRATSPVEVCQAYLDRVHRLDGTLNSFITVMKDEAMEAARAAEAEIRRGTYRGPLHGVPMGLKDGYAVAGVRTTGGSRLLERWVPDYDHAVVERLRAAGAIIIGKQNMHEFAYSGIATELLYGPILNPWNQAYSPGGSSGGSAAAVAAGLCAAAVGTDGAGSVRRPAAPCGLSGRKPTNGRVSRRGQVPAPQSSVDHPGILTRSVRDNALVLQAVAGFDPGDAGTARVPVPDYAAALTGDVKGLRIGIPKPAYGPISREVGDAVGRAIEVLQGLGMSVKQVALPHAHGAYTSAMEAPVLSAEGHATRLHDLLVEHNGTIQDLGPDLRANYLVGRLMPASFYLTALKARQVLLREFKAAFAEVDVIVTPMSPAQGQTAADDVGNRIDVDGKSIEYAGLGRAFAIVYNLTGLPALTVPCGFSTVGLPIGVEIAGRPFDEATVFRVGDAYQGATDWHTRHPSL
jgi:aspartyl-tRNA(Asn)/glutamyl-tRNA(Gln) amidotransferase subunit A